MKVSPSQFTIVRSAPLAASEGYKSMVEDLPLNARTIPYINSNLYNNSAPIKPQNHSRITSLYVSIVKNGHMEIVTYLIEKGANVTRKCTMDGKEKVQMLERDVTTELTALYIASQKWYIREN
ncbi:hypothetical protein H8356DRAFT_1437467 [Neocallimastix lanati (nom. inval.)]|nr:hypothetical protein H8356DRAFT_1437467 [Neocallimastix sp. JGI-2020a]